ncbi:hypothetical protein C5S30_07870 [ANME-1 cluster archaeon GoMg4]|nr:hypothetical protein [ANME-1 cluster archaeon GoMg4]
METVCIPRERYEYLIKCERLVDMEFEEKKGKNYFTDSGIMTMFTDNIISAQTRPLMPSSFMN